MKQERIESLGGRMETVSAEERQEYLDARLREIVRYAYSKAPAIRARFDKAGINPSDVSSIKDLEALPILRKDELVDLYAANPPLGGLVTVPIHRLKRVYISPGPIYDPHHHSKNYWERHVHVVRALGFCEDDVVVNTWAYHLTPAGLLWDEALRRAGVTVIPTGVGNTELQVQVMCHLKVTGFLGTTGFFMNILNRAEEIGYDIRRDFNLRLVCIGGEMGGGQLGR